MFGTVIPNLQEGISGYLADDDNQEAGRITAIAREIVTDYYTWKHFFTETGSPKPKAESMFDIFNNLKKNSEIDRVLRDVAGYSDASDRDGIMMAIARDIAINHRYWARFFDANGALKDPAMFELLFKTFADKGFNNFVKTELSITKLLKQSQIDAIKITTIRDEITKRLKAGDKNISSDSLIGVVKQFLIVEDEIAPYLKIFYGEKFNIANTDGEDMGRLTAWANAVVNKEVDMDALKEVIKLYHELWLPDSQRPIEILRGPDISWLASKDFDKNMKVSRREFFEYGVKIQQLSRGYLRRDMMFDEIVVRVTEYGKSIKSLMRGDRIIFDLGRKITDWHTESTFRSVLSKGKDEAYNRTTGPEQERRRFVLWEGRHMLRILSDDECAYWESKLGNMLPANQGLFSSDPEKVEDVRDLFDISASVIDIARSLEFSEIDYTPDMFSREKIDKYIIMRMVTRPVERKLSNGEKDMPLPEFFNEMFRVHNIDKDGIVKGELEYWMNLLRQYERGERDSSGNRLGISRSQIKALINDAAAITSEVAKDWGITLPLSTAELLREIYRVRKSGCIESLVLMERSVADSLVAKIINGEITGYPTKKDVKDALVEYISGITDPEEKLRLQRFTSPTEDSNELDENQKKMKGIINGHILWEIEEQVQEKMRETVAGSEPEVRDYIEHREGMAKRNEKAILRYADKFAGTIAALVILFAALAMLLQWRNRVARLRPAKKDIDLGAAGPYRGNILGRIRNKIDALKKERSEIKAAVAKAKESMVKEAAEKGRVAPNFPARFQLKMAAVLAGATLYVAARFFSFNFFAIVPQFSLVDLVLFALLGWWLNRVFFARVLSFHKKATLKEMMKNVEHEDYRDGVPEDHRSFITIPTMGAIDPALRQLITDTFRNCRDKKKGNIGFIVYNAKPPNEEDEANAKIVQTIVNEFRDKGELLPSEGILYVDRDVARAIINLDKKFLSLSDLLRLIGQGVVKPESAGELHVGYKLSHDVFLKGAYATAISTIITWVSLPVLFGFSALSAIAVGMTIGIVIGTAWAIYVSGEKGSHILEAKGYDMPKRPMINKIWGDMRLLGFKSPAGFDPKKPLLYTDVLANLDPVTQRAQLVTPEDKKEGEYLPPWAIFTLDNKNGAGIPDPRPVFVREAKEELMGEDNLNPTPEQIDARARELDPMVDPIRKIIEDGAAHPEVTFVTPYIYITADLEPDIGIPEPFVPAPESRTPYAQYLATAQQAVAHFENSMMFNLSNAPVTIWHSLIIGSVIGLTLGTLFGGLNLALIGFSAGGFIGLVLRLIIKRKDNAWNPTSSFYGKGLIVIQPWLRGIKRPDKPPISEAFSLKRLARPFKEGIYLYGPNRFISPLPRLYFIGMLGGTSLGLLAAYFFGVSYFGTWALIGMSAGLWIFGGKEGMYHFGVFLAGYFQELSHDYFECTFGRVMHSVRAMIFEPANANAKAQEEREMRWWKGVVLYIYHIFTAGVDMQQRYLMSICVMMYMIGPIFVLWLRQSWIAQTYSGIADKIQPIQRLQEYGQQTLSSLANGQWLGIALLVMTILGVLVLMAWAYHKSEAKHPRFAKAMEKLIGFTYMISPILILLWINSPMAQIFAGPILNATGQWLAIGLLIFMIIAMVIMTQISTKEETKHYGAVSIARKLGLLHFANATYLTNPIYDVLRNMKGLFERSVAGFPDMPRKINQIETAVYAITTMGTTTALMCYFQSYWIGGIALSIFAFLTIKRLMGRFIPTMWVVAGIMLAVYMVSPLWVTALFSHWMPIWANSSFVTELLPPFINQPLSSMLMSWVTPYLVSVPIVVYLLKRTAYLYKLLNAHNVDEGPVVWGAFKETGAKTARETFIQAAIARKWTLIVGTELMIEAALYWSNYWPFIWGIAIFYSWSFGFFYRWWTSKPNYLFEGNVKRLTPWNMIKSLPNLWLDDFRIYVAGVGGELYNDLKQKVPEFSTKDKIPIDDFREIKTKKELKDLLKKFFAKKKEARKYGLGDIALRAKMLANKLFTIGFIAGVIIAVPMIVFTVFYSVGIASGFIIALSLALFFKGLIRLDVEKRATRVLGWVYFIGSFVLVGVFLYTAVQGDLFGLDWMHWLKGPGVTDDFSVVSVAFAIPALFGYALASVFLFLGWLFDALGFGKLWLYDKVIKPIWQNPSLSNLKKSLWPVSPIKIPKVTPSQDRGKGSVRSALKAMYELFKNESVTVNQLIESRQFSETTVRKELEMLELLGLIDVDKGSRIYKYMLKSEIRNLSPPQLDYILTIPELDRYEIPQQDIQRIRDQIDNYLSYQDVVRSGNIQNIFDFFYRITDLSKLKDVKGGAAFQMADGSYMDMLMHMREVIHSLQMLEDNSYDYFNNRRYPKDGREFSRETFARVKAVYDELMADPSYRETLQVFVALHDYGKIWGEDHYINGAREVEPLLHRIGMVEDKIKLIQTLILRHSDLGELYLGESVPDEDIKFLKESGFDVDKFLKMQLILHVCDVNSVGQGRLTANQLEEFVKYTDTGYLGTMQGQWGKGRLVNLMGLESASTMELYEIMAFQVVRAAYNDIPEEEITGFNQFMNNMKFRRLVFLVRNMNPENIVKWFYLMYLAAKLTDARAGQNVDFIWFTSDKEAAKIDTALATLTLADISGIKFTKTAIEIPATNTVIPIRLDIDNKALVVDTANMTVAKPIIAEQARPQAPPVLVEQIFARYGRGEIKQVTQLIPGMAESQPQLIETNEDKFVLVKSSLRNTPSSIEWECSLLERLKKNGFIVVPQLYRTSGGEPFVKVGSDFYKLYEFRPGAHVNWGEIKGAKAKEAAKIQALYHNAVRGAQPEGLNLATTERLYPLAEPSNPSEMRAWFHKARDSLPDEILQKYLGQLAFFESQLDKLEKNALTNGYAALPQLIIHGDYNSNNILFEGDNISGLIDFDYTRKTARIIDLVNGAINIDWNSSDPLKDLIAYLRTYQENADDKLTIEELKALPDAYRAWFLEAISMSIYWIYAKRPQISEQMIKDMIQGNLNNIKALDESIKRGDWEKLFVELSAPVIKKPQTPSETHIEPPSQMESDGQTTWFGRIRLRLHNLLGSRGIPFSHWNDVSAVMRATVDTDAEQFNYWPIQGEKKVLIATRLREGVETRIEGLVKNAVPAADIVYKITQEVFLPDNRRVTLVIYCFELEKEKDIDKLKNILATTDRNYRGYATMPSYSTSGLIAVLKRSEIPIEVPASLNVQEDENLKGRAEQAIRRLETTMNELGEDAKLVDPALKFVKMISRPFDYNAHKGMNGLTHLASTLKNTLEKNREEIRVWDDKIAESKERLEDLEARYASNGIKKEDFEKEQDLINKEILTMSNSRDVAEMICNAMSRFWFNLVNQDGDYDSQALGIRAIGDIEKKAPLIIFAEFIDPLEINALSKKYDIEGIVTVEGATTSHGAIYAKNKGIPVIVIDVPDSLKVKGVPNSKAFINEISRIIKESKARKGKVISRMVLMRSDVAGNGEVVLRPSLSTVKVSYGILLREVAFDTFAMQQTKDRCENVPIGQTETTTSLYVNADSETEIQEGIEKYKAAGVGLVRTEYLFTDENIFEPQRPDIKGNRIVREYLESPAEEKREQLKDHLREYFLRIARAAQGAPVTIRTLDLQPDKKNLILQKVKNLSGMEFYKSPLGRDILLIQLEAIMEARLLGVDNLKVMFPMVSSIDDVGYLITRDESVWASARLNVVMGSTPITQDARYDVKKAHAIIGRINSIKKGIMVETSVAVDNIKLLAAVNEIDFYSIGTNDLSSYVIGKALGRKDGKLDRDNPLDKQYLSRLQPVVLEKIAAIIETIRDENRERAAEGMPRKELSICGEMASWYGFELFIAKKMKKLGIKEGEVPLSLSMSGYRVPHVNVFLRNIVEEDYAGIDTFLADAVDEVGPRSVDYVANNIVIGIFDRIYQDRKIHDIVTRESAPRSESELANPPKEERSLRTLQLILARNGVLKTLPLSRPGMAITPLLAFLVPLIAIAILPFIHSVPLQIGIWALVVGLEGVYLLSLLKVAEVLQPARAEPNVIIGIPANGSFDAMEERVREALMAAGANLEVARMDENEFAKLAKARNFRGIFIKDIFYIDSPRKFVGDIKAAKLAVDYEILLTMNDVSVNTREELSAAIKAILPNIASVNAADIFNRAQEVLAARPELASQIPAIQKLIAKRKHEIAGIYNGMAIDKTVNYDNRIAVATTEKIAKFDPFTFDNIETAQKQGIVNVFIYGDTLKDIDSAKRFVKACGYRGNIDDLRFIDKRGKKYEHIVAEIAAFQTGLKAESIGIRAAAGEFADEKVAKSKLLEIQPIDMNGQEMYPAMNSYQVLLKIVLAGTGEIIIPGVSKDDVRGIFKYLPRAIPIDYEKEIRSYIEAIEIIRTAA
ncbi:MAG: putative PEP-binding protein [Candidatus Omnitrophota bacterium]|nr:putative PEP-binding protein [Candidatus Omnitrophota bacterium]